MTFKAVALKNLIVDREGLDEAHVVKLKESIEAGLLLHPITVNKAGKVIAGRHRYWAAHDLGHKKIDVKVVNVSERVEQLATLDENLMRRDRSALELGELLRARKLLYEQMTPGASKQGGDRTKPSLARSATEFIAGNSGLAQRTVQEHIAVAEKIAPEAKEVIAETGVARSIKELTRLAQLEPGEQLAVAAQIAEGDMTVKQAERKLRMRKQVAQAKAYVLPPGKFAVIVADPPWQYDDELNGSLNRALPYPTMPLEEICAMEVADRAADDCALFLWTTKSHLLDGSAAKVCSAWGFTPKSMITWVKSNIGLGRYVRNRCEFVVIATRGSPPFDLEGDTSLKDDVIIQTGPRLEHSEKPDEFFARVEALCPSPARIELFARAPRPGWTGSGSELSAAQIAAAFPTVPAEVVPTKAENMGDLTGTKFGERLAQHEAKKRRKLHPVDCTTPDCPVCRGAA